MYIKLLFIIIILITIYVNYFYNPIKIQLYNIILNEHNIFKDKRIDTFIGRKEDFIYALRIKLYTVIPDSFTIFAYNIDDHLLLQNIPKTSSEWNIGQREGKPVSIELNSISNQIHTIIFVFGFKKQLNIKDSVEVNEHIGGKPIKVAPKNIIVLNNYKYSDLPQPLKKYIKPDFIKKQIPHKIFIKIDLTKQILSYSNITIEVSSISTDS